MREPQKVDMLALAKRIDLGNVFEFRHNPNDDNDRDPHAIRFHHVILGGYIYITKPGYGSWDKFSVGCTFQTDSIGQTHLDDHYSGGKDRHDSINISVTKTPEQISAEIIRRYIPRFLELARKNLDGIIRFEEGQKRRSDFGHYIKAKFPQYFNLHDGTTTKDARDRTAVSLTSMGGPHIGITVSDNGASLSTLTLSMGEVDAMLTALYDYRRANEMKDGE